MATKKKAGRGRRGPLPDYYRVLGVPQEASVREIEDAYWERAFRIHSRGDREAARSRLLRLNEAYEVLATPEYRKAYDAKRGTAAAATEERGWLRRLLGGSQPGPA